jgi:hypothetical protein
MAVIFRLDRHNKDEPSFAGYLVATENIQETLQLRMSN